ncbi:3-oxoacyl-ACP synthase III family protein [Streptomyces sp. NBC_00878]|uniref:3-oxoacyl-ACP synthase III family protein n=1 Tax=Streptomyces sp. NBC_00878 TaxID=2975854 RepID=UPI0022530F29|nr:ketoacyl-ACP synthase III [Streptomyces sp. NBC_00878]MCX4907711.1 ketoacyl-ACP synthase III [Streptomyces sp. NBC_00878]
MIPPLPTSVGIRSIGGYLPKEILDNAELEGLLDTTAAWIDERLGIHQRHIAAPDQQASDLGLAALQEALDIAGVPLRNVDLLICGTVTPDHMLPATAAAIAHKAGLNGVPCFDVNSGACAGGVFALDVGARYVASGQYRCVAVVLTDVMSRICATDDRTTRAIFGDGAACYLLQPCEAGRGIGVTLLKTMPDWYYTAHVRRSPSQDPRANLFSGDNALVMNGAEVRDFALDTIPHFIQEVAAAEGIGVDAADLIVLHQANARLIPKILRRVGVSADKTVVTAGYMGNTSGASVPLALCEALKEGRIQPGSLILAVAFGSGLSMGGTVIRWCAKEDFLPPPT